MKRTAPRFPIGLLALFGWLLLAAGGCGGGGASASPLMLNPPSEGVALESALRELDALPTPAGVDADLFTQLRAELAAQLSARGVARFGSDAPQGSLSEVLHLAPLRSACGEIRIAWVERNSGDYNLDGEVNISDLTALGQRFGEQLDDGDDDTIDMVIDGDGNGEINVADITPIAANYMAKVQGYKVFRGLPGGEQLELIGAVQRDWSMALPKVGHVYAFSDLTVERGQTYVYQIRPFNGEALGIPSERLVASVGCAYGMGGPPAEVLELTIEDRTVLADPAELLLEFAEPPHEGAVFDTIYRRLGGLLLGRIDRAPIYRVLMPKRGRDILRVVADFNNKPLPGLALHFDFLDPTLDIWGPDGKGAATTYSDPEYADQWALATVGAEDAWDDCEGSGVLLGLIDSGIMSTHEDLTNKWSGMARVGATSDEERDGTVYEDLNGHGTAVAGVMSMEAGNGVGGCGLAHRAGLYSIKTGRFMIRDGQWEWMHPHSQVISALGLAITEGIDVLNMSLGGSTRSAAYENAIDDALAAGIVIIAAAGNSNEEDEFFPAAYSGVCSVGATDSSNDRWTSSTNPDSGSQYGSWVDICAPGADVRSAELGGGYDDYWGTSLAAPHVTAATALVRAFDPSLSRTQVVQQLLDTALPITTDQPIGDLLNVGDAVGEMGTQEIEVTCDDPIFIVVETGGGGSYYFEIANTGSHDLNWSINPHYVFTSFTPDSGTISGGSNATIRLDYTAPTTVDNYTNPIEVVSNDYSEPVTELDFILAVTEPEIDVTPTSLEINVEAGEQTSENINVANLGNADLSFYAEASGDLITCGGGSYWFQLDVGPNDDRDISVDVDLEHIIQLGNIAGTYYGEVTVYSSDPDEPEIVVDVTINVTDGSVWPEIDVDDSLRQLNLAPSDVVTEDILITNTGTADLVWWADVYGPILSCTMPMGVLPPGDSTNLEITVTAPASEGLYSEYFRLNCNMMPMPVIEIDFEVNVAGSA